MVQDTRDCRSSSKPFGFLLALRRRYWEGVSSRFVEWFHFNSSNSARDVIIKGYISGCMLKFEITPKRGKEMVYRGNSRCGNRSFLSSSLLFDVFCLPLVKNPST